MKIDISNDRLLLEEALYSTANGYIGMRANFEEGYRDGYESIRGSYLNGFYETYPIVYGESAYGFPKTGQKMVNVFDGQGIRIIVGDETFSVFDGHVHSMKRGLDLERGYAYRMVDWSSPKGHRLKFEFRRLTSFVVRELAVLSVVIQSVNYEGPIEIVSSVKGAVHNYASEDDPRVADDHGTLLELESVDVLGSTVIMSGSTLVSGNSVALAVDHKPAVFPVRTGKHTEGVYKDEISPQSVLSFCKYLVFTDSIRHEGVEETGMAILDRVMKMGQQEIFSLQKRYLDEFWDGAKVEIDGDASVEESINYGIYQLLASAGTLKESQISAKGLSGEGYEGHYFWDTEIYMIPFFTVTNPEVARKLLMYRYETLESAKERAEMMGHAKGAKIPWRTICGKECSAYFPAGSAQYHINADVAYAMIQYYLMTDDFDFMVEAGIEVIFETARIWIDMGNFDAYGRFNINDVTGPDEYTAVVNNNYYTNSMAKYHLEWTQKLLDKLEKTDVKLHKALVKHLGITRSELDLMEDAASDMYLPYDMKLGISVQDDSFLCKKPWNFEGTEPTKYPLLLHYHPLTIYRHQVLKQADTVLAHFLLDNEMEEVMKRSYDFYETLTTHDSSLSPCVYSMMAARNGDVDKAYDYYMKTIRLDLDDLHHNTKDGLHIANAGGVYMGIVFGFGGLRIKEDGIHLRPVRPKQWKRISFKVKYRKALLTVSISDKLVVESSEPVLLHIYGERRQVTGRLEVDLHEGH